MTKGEQCNGRVASGGYRSYPCGNTGKHEYKGKLYCLVHHPLTMLAKRTAARQKRAVEWAEQQEKREAEATKHAELLRKGACYDELREVARDALNALVRIDAIQGYPNNAKVIVRLRAVLKAK